MHVIPYIVAYVAVFVFAVAVVARFVMFSRLPMHVRWELYPVAHEGKRASYGGSYLEEFEWWSKPREKSALGELRAMGAEILFLVALKEHNRRMWTRSFPFHFGLYLLIGCTLLLVVAAVLAAAWPGLAGGTLLAVLRWIATICGVAGLGLGLLGAVGLLARRLTARDLKAFTSPADIFNLVFFIVAFGLAFVHFLVFDRDFARVGGFVANLVRLDPTALPGDAAAVALYGVSVVFLGALLAYIPLTHMSHFVGKYFAYHAVRWNDEPNLPGAGDDPRLGEMLGQKVGWSAPHIRGDDPDKTWADAATENPERKEK